MVDFVVLASVVFAFGLVSRRLEGTILTAPIVFVAAGMVLGPAGLGLVEFGLDDHTVLLLGEIALALVLSTDAALGKAVVSNPRVPVRVRQALNVEAGLNDGLSVPFLALFLIVAVEEERLSANLWIRFALEQIGLGVLVGISVGLAGGWLVSRASRRAWMTGSFQRPAGAGAHRLGTGR